MAAAIDGVLPKALQEHIKSAKVLVVGAGGIGCEVLKNLVMTGFEDIEIIDLDTIDLSNLNRQFLFHREHVGKSKAQVAKESALSFNPDAKIVAYHDSILSTDYNVNFFKKFTIVLSALDNRIARNHVNRMCLNADVPLIESGTSGYVGQVEFIKKGLSLCYECTPKAPQRSFPGCTIRNTPSEPIHCIVWAKHLFNQLFGETVDDEDISPDMADPEAQEKSGDGSTNGKNVPQSGNLVRINTRNWAKDEGYDAARLFNKFFYDDINYLLSMSNLWKSRKPPNPVKWQKLRNESSANEAGDSPQKTNHQYHKIWTLSECASVFSDCLKTLSSNFLKLEGNDCLVWDKDDQPAMDFVAACANIRAHIFGIQPKTRFEIKSMAGNIIPAIATTNAMTAGISVMRAFNVLEEEYNKCKSVYVRLRPTGLGQIIVSDKNLVPPNPNCYVCSTDPAIHLRVDTNRMKMKEFRDEVLIKSLNMIVPEVVLDSTGNIVISSDEEETECNDGKLLSEMNIIDGSILKCDDFVQSYNLLIIIVHFDAERDQNIYEVIADKNQLQPKEDTEAMEVDKKTPEKRKGDNGHLDDEDGPSTSKRLRVNLVDEEDDDLEIIEDDDEIATVTEADTPATDKLKDDDLEIIEDDNDLSTVTEAVTSATDKLTVTSPTTQSSGIKRKTNEPEEISTILDSDEENMVLKKKKKLNL